MFDFRRLRELSASPPRCEQQRPDGDHRADFRLRHRSEQIKLIAAGKITGAQSKPGVAKTDQIRWVTGDSGQFIVLDWRECALIKDGEVIRASGLGLNCESNAFR